MDKKDITTFLKGDNLYGDDFSIVEIQNWFDEEKEGYAELGAKDKTHYTYPYHEQNKKNGFKFIKTKKINNVLSIGGAYGDELLPIIDKIERITILEPSEQLRKPFLKDVPLNYISPDVSGVMPFNDNSFDLVTCFGVLHHIPNVSFVMSEVFRVLKQGGTFLLREPIVSMGDWTKKRGNLTKNERGIPLPLFRDIINQNEFKIVNEQLCNAKPFDLIFSKIFGRQAYNSPFYVNLDKSICTIIKHNYKYHASSTIQKIRPVAVFYTLKK